MTQSQIHTVMVAGAGVLGGQIAYQSAYKGKKVFVYDVNEASLSKCKQVHQSYADIYREKFALEQGAIDEIQQRICYTTDLHQAASQSDLIIEAVPEVPEIKQSFYQQLAKHITQETLVATNSSTLKPTDFIESITYPEQFCALHFANYIWEFNFAEVMAHATTSKPTLTRIFQFAIEIGMVPVPVKKEVNGYILNGWTLPLLTASLNLVVNGVGSAEDVDRSYMMLNKGCQMGPLGILDMFGMNTTYNVSQYWGELFQEKRMLENAAFIKEQFVDQGKLGVLSGEGFYQYPNPQFSQPEFLNPPDRSEIPNLVKKALFNAQ